MSAVPFAAAAAAAEPIRRWARPGAPGQALAVRVDDVPLVFTGQITAPRPGGGDRAEADAALAELVRLLGRAGSSAAQIVRLNAYVVDDAAVGPVEAALAAAGAAQPAAFTLVKTPLAAPGARVAFEAVAATAPAGPRVTVRESAAAVLPAGGKIFISGQAERGTDVATAVRATMAGLMRTLVHLGVEPADVVQVKAFLTPFSDHAAAQREIAASFAPGAVPPAVLMAWESTLFTEIEMVVAAGARPAPASDRVAYLPLPWLTPSPRYSKVCHVAAGTPLIFVAGVDAGETGTAREQMKTIFERLGSLLFETGSSYRNLVKATYYLAAADSRTVLGDIRGVYFDPTRAPAASALQVPGLGRPGRTAMIDLIAVPVK